MSFPPRTFHHVAVATESIRDTAPTYELLTGHSCSPVEEIEDQGVRVAFVGPVELLEPSDPTGTVARFLERRGAGLHHVAFGVPDLAAELARLEREGVPLIDREPRVGARGHLVAFLHPRAAGGVLLELVQL